MEDYEDVTGAVGNPAGGTHSHTKKKVVKKY